jgi:hypothetical protein
MSLADRQAAPRLATMRTTSHHRSGFVQFQQQLARQALLGGKVGAARLALRVLQTSDFAGGPAVSGDFLTVLRDARSTDEEVLTAVRALIELGPSGIR